MQSHIRDINRNGQVCKAGLTKSCSDYYSPTWICQKINLAKTISFSFLIILLAQWMTSCFGTQDRDVTMPRDIVMSLSGCPWKAEHAKPQCHTLQGKGDCLAHKETSFGFSLSVWYFCLCTPAAQSQHHLPLVRTQRRLDRAWGQSCAAPGVRAPQAPPKMHLCVDVIYIDLKPLFSIAWKEAPGKGVFKWHSSEWEGPQQQRDLWGAEQHLNPLFTGTCFSA